MACKGDPSQSYGASPAVWKDYAVLPGFESISPILELHISGKQDFENS